MWSYFSHLFLNILEFLNITISIRSSLAQVIIVILDNNLTLSVKNGEQLVSGISYSLYIVIIHPKT